MVSVARPAEPASSGNAAPPAPAAEDRLPGGAQVFQIPFAEIAMNPVPPCPKCKMENTYPDGDAYICADCGHEWPVAAAAPVAEEESGLVVKDANGNLLADGDAVILIKDLKVKGSSLTIKGGTKIRSIRLVSGDHEVDCKVDGVSLMLKAQYLKKAT